VNESIERCRVLAEVLADIESEKGYCPRGVLGERSAHYRAVGIIRQPQEILWLSFRQVGFVVWSDTHYFFLSEFRITCVS
jgi:hypothetical protein